MNDIFDDENEVKPAWVKWGKVGDSIAGTLVNVNERQSSFDSSQVQKIYTIKADKGSFHNIVDRKVDKAATEIEAGQIWNVGGKEALDAQMQQVKAGQKIGLKYTDEQPAKTPGYNPSKFIKLYTTGEMDEEWLNSEGLTANDV